MRTLPPIAACAAVALALAGCGHGGGHDHGSAARPCDGYGSAKVGAYTVLVALERAEPILPAAEAETSTAEGVHVALSGTPVNTPEANRHLEVMVCDAASGAMAMDAAVTATIRDATDGGTPVDVPIVAMRGLGDPEDHVHYGNNIAFPDGHQAEVAVTIGDASGVFKVAAE